MGRKKNRIVVKCRICRIEFEVPPSRLIYGRGKTCSRECQYKLVGKLNSNSIRKRCKKCNKVFYRAPSILQNRAKQGAGQYCSTVCAYASKKTGKDAANWRGGITINPERKSPEYKLFVQSVLARDDYKCRKCGSSRRLHVHHVKPFAKYPELRTTVSNGKTLCQKCHSKVHRRKIPLKA